MDTPRRMQACASYKEGDSHCEQCYCNEEHREDSFCSTSCISHKAPPCKPVLPTGMAKAIDAINPDPPKTSKDIRLAPHYTWHPSGVSCRTICQEFPHNLASAIEYIWRADHKGNFVEDIRKAIECLNWELIRRFGDDFKDDKDRIIYEQQLEIFKLKEGKPE